MLSIRKLQHLLNHQRGQGMVEMALLMCFAVAVVVGVNWDSFKESMGIPYLRMAKRVGMNTSTTNPVDISAYATMPTSELQLVNNEERIAADKATMTALGEFLLTLNKSDIANLFPGTKESRWTGTDGSGKPGVALFDYCIENAGDNGEALKVKLRHNDVGYLSNQQAIQWLQGNYDKNTEPYKGNKSEIVSNRFFYSNDAINPRPQAHLTKGEQSATLWAAFTFDSGGDVTSVKLSMTRSYQENGNSGAWKRTNCEGLTDVVVSK
ncbi:hypothetical protein [Selenomonas sp. AB3002]|uniref:hypothetical protein n=1 Tax=Selenomonas sp. AB3002 TaxID=1392502 RepID=UPI0004967492